MLLVSTVGFTCMPEIVVWPESTLDMLLLIISIMRAIYSSSNNKLISYSTE